MARTDDEALRACPTCGTKVKDATNLGLRDYTWVSKQLPGKVSLTDGDGFLERKGEVLQFEFKPKGAYIPLGQKIFLKTMVRKGIHVWIVWGDGLNEDVQVGAMDRRGEVPFVEDMPLDEFIERVMDWWQAADNREL